MKHLIGMTYEQLATALHANPEKYYYSPESHDGFSVFIYENEYLFWDGKLFSIEISNFTSLNSIPGFTFPGDGSLEQTITLLESRMENWEIYSKYSRDHWVVVRLIEHDLLYEFEFEDEAFALRFIRLQTEWK